ncbi:MAG TPA: hypothetical protein VF756_17460 [Thermoanaerobaculia bacterium]
MRSRSFVLGAAALLCALPLLAQDIPAGDDVWDSLGGGATETVLTSADWAALCGATVPDTAVQLKGFNIAGYGTGDTVVSRLDNASFANGNTTRVRIRLKELSFVSDGSHPCSPLTIRVTEDSTQSIGTMTITRTSSAGGTFSASVPVNAIVESVDGNGNVHGSTYVSGSLDDESASPWSYSGPTTGEPTTQAAATSPWHPGVDPVTKKPVRICRRGNKILPARHCYWPPPKCTAVAKDPVPVGAASANAVAAEPCTVEVQPVTDVK